MLGASWTMTDQMKHFQRDVVCLCFSSTGTMTLDDCMVLC